MSRLCRTIRNSRCIRAGTVAGRQGLFLDDNALQLPMQEHLCIANAGRDGDAAKLPASPAIRPAASLSAGQKGIIRIILKKSGGFQDGDLQKFAMMHPGLRELRFRNYESSLWTDGGWKKILGAFIAEGKRLASGFERADLIAGSLYAARTQYGSLCFDLGLAAPSQSERAEALMQPGELSKSQAAFFRKAAAEDGVLQKELDDFKSWAAGLSPEDLRHAWRRMEPNIVTAASVAHKLRFRSTPFTSDEDLFVRNLYGKADVGVAEMLELRHAFCNSHLACRSVMEKIAGRIKYPDEPILEAARASSEFDTLLDFLFIPREKNLARISITPGFTKAHSVQDAQHPDNDDALTSISLVCQRTTGKTYYADLDVVFDGVSGHGGASVASRIAKDAFEISALAGWISWAEDVRFVTLLADIAIDIEKRRLKQLAARASGEEKTRLLQMQDMGTTMAASYIEGDDPYLREDFYGIHCGDSDYKLVRRGVVIFKSIPHGYGNTIWSGLGIGTQAIHINNEDSCYKPVKLMDGDAVLTLTDGIGDVTCDHEHGSLAAANANDAGKLSAAIVSTADSRKDVLTAYSLGCSCKEIGGKDDDMTLITRFVRLSMPEKKA